MTRPTSQEYRTTKVVRPVHQEFDHHIYEIDAFTAIIA